MRPLLLLLSLLIFFSSCSHHEQNETFYKSAFKIIDTRDTKGDASGARFYMDSIFSKNVSALPPYYRYLVYTRLAKWTYFSPHRDSTAFYVDSMLYMMETYEVRKAHSGEYADALNNKGDYYIAKQDFPMAFEYFSRSRIAALNAKDTCAYSNQTYHLGMVTYRQEKYFESAAYFKEAYKETGTCNDEQFTFFRKEELLSNIGLAYIRLREYDSAVIYYHMAATYADTSSKRINLPGVLFFAEKANGVIAGNIAKVYIARGQRDTAEQLLLQSIAINSRPGYELSDAMYSTIQLAELYFGWHKLDQTKVTLKQLQQALDTLPDNDIRLRYMHLMYLYSKETRDPDAALRHLESYMVLRDSSDQVNKELKQTDYAELLKNEEAQYHIGYLEKSRELDRLYLLIVISLTLITIMVVIMVYANYRRSKKHVKLLKFLNQRVNDQKGQLETALRQLQQSNNDKDRILHVVAHDLRNPVTAIMSLADIMNEAGVNEEQADLLKMMSSAGNSSLMLIGEILEFSGDRMRNPAGEKKVYDVNELVKHTQGILQFKAADKKQAIRLALTAEPLNVIAYPGKIERVLGNLVANAIKFSPENSEILISVSRKGDKVITEVKDNGIGIPEKSKPHIFDMFTNAKRYGTSGEASFGLGLSICKQIVEAAGGRIWFESAEGKGSSFFIGLPLV